jgi:hypothetical protein
MPALTIPRIEGRSQKEFLKAIKGDPAPGSNFDYSTKLTEMSLVCVIPNVSIPALNTMLQA